MYSVKLKPKLQNVNLTLIPTLVLTLTPKLKAKGERRRRCLPRYHTTDADPASNYNPASNHALTLISTPTLPLPLPLPLILDLDLAMTPTLPLNLIPCRCRSTRALGMA